jgi:hypothetical protein
VNLGELVNSFRAQVGEQSTRRFTPAIVADYANRAQRSLAFEFDFPEATQSIATIAGQQEYQLVEMMKLLRVYIQGPNGSKQELIASDIFTLEGDILQNYDNTSGFIQGGPVQSSNFSAQQPRAYPVQNVGFSGSTGAPVPTKNPWGPNSRPCYYLRGGYIGIMPAPLVATGVTIGVDHIPKPPDLSLTSDVSIYPDIFLDAIIWKMISYARFSDNTSSYKDAELMYQMEVKERINPWLQRFQATKPKTFVPRTIRNQFRRRGYGP